MRLVLCMLFMGMATSMYSQYSSSHLYQDICDSIKNVQLALLGEQYREDINWYYSERLNDPNDWRYIDFLMRRYDIYYRLYPLDREGEHPDAPYTTLFFEYCVDYGKHRNSLKHRMFIKGLSWVNRWYDNSLVVDTAQDISQHLYGLCYSFDKERILSEAKLYAAQDAQQILFTRVIIYPRDSKYQIDCMAFPQYTHPDYPESAVNPPPRYRDPKEGFIIMMDEDGLCKEYDESFKKVFQ